MYNWQQHLEAISYLTLHTNWHFLGYKAVTKQITLLAFKSKETPIVGL